MQGNDKFKAEIKERLEKLCPKCDKLPTLNESELQPIGELELVEKWRKKK